MSRIRHVAALTLVSAIWLSTRASAADDVVAVAKRVRPYVAHVESYAFHMGAFLQTKTGSAVYVGTQKGPKKARAVFVTNAHVVENCDLFSVTTDDNRAFAASLVYFDREQDVALLIALGMDAPRLGEGPVISTRTPEVGESVIAIGSPIGLKGTVSTGIVSAVREMGGMRVIQTSASASPGSSGGGLFDLQGRLIGLVTFKVTQGENLNFAIESSTVAKAVGPRTNTLDAIPDIFVAFAVGWEAGAPGRQVEPNPARDRYLAMFSRFEDARKAAEEVPPFGIGAKREDVELLNRCDALALAMLSAYPADLRALNAIAWAHSLEMAATASHVCAATMPEAGAMRLIEARQLFASGRIQQGESAIRELFAQLPTRGAIRLSGWDESYVAKLNDSIDASVARVLVGILHLRPQIYKELLKQVNKKGWCESLRKLTPY